MTTSVLLLIGALFIRSSLAIVRSSGLALGQAEVLLDHLPADGMVKVAIVLERLDGEVAVDLVQAAVERADKLHAPDLPQEVGHAGVRAGVLRLHRDMVVRRLELDVLGFRQAVDAAQFLLLSD